MFKRLFVFICFFSMGCSKNTEVLTSAFFGGQIINPSSEYVSLYKNDERMDSLPLDKQNRFSKKYDSLDYGLFVMEHLPEKQMVLIEAGDSIWSRANMSDFNASLVFSGKGSAKNNFLMDVFLSLQNEVNYLSSAYALNGIDFEQIIDSLLQEKKQKWIDFKEQTSLSPLAQKVTQAAYVYPYANRLERYALIRGKNNAIQTDSTYFKFRKYLNYGEKDLVYFEPYITYLISYISQEALIEGKSFFQQKNTSEFNIRRMQIIDDRISNPELRNSLARTVAYEELVTFENHTSHELFLKYYVTVNTSAVYLREILTLHRSIQAMEAGQSLPNVILENHLGEYVSSNEIFKNQKTVIYFWSQTQMNHFRRTQERVNLYKENYPNYRYVGISIQPYNELVRDYQKIMSIQPENQFAAQDFELLSSKWVINLLNKGIIIDEKRQILEGFGNFSAKSFDSLLEKHQ